MNRHLSLLLSLTVTAGLLAGGAYLTRDRWSRLFSPPAAVAEDDHDNDHPAERVKLTEQGRRNLGLVVAPAPLKTAYWRTVQIPGVVVDRPGQSDRGVTAPVTAVVTNVTAFPSDIVNPGDTLFELRLTSEFVQNAQAELFKATKDEEIAAQQLKRLLTAGGAVAEGRLTEARGLQTKLAAQVRSYRQILQASGLTPQQIDKAAGGTFVTSLAVIAPTGGPYEMQELKAQLGQQVQAGQVLAMLADHRHLYIEGHAFRSEAGLLAKAAENGWPVDASFTEDDAAGWPPTGPLMIRHLSSEMDPESRTFGFFIPLTNPSRRYARDGKSFLVWRFRPGQRVRVRVPLEPLRDVIVLPAEAVVRDGPEAYVFRANGDALDRKPVTLLHLDARDAVLANDGSLDPGLAVAMNGAAALNRALKAQQAGGGDEHHHHHH